MKANAALGLTTICLMAIGTGVAVNLPAHAQSQPLDGAALYRQHCQSCHGSPAKPSSLAPSLAGVEGRKAASTSFAYSSAMSKSGLVWTRANLDRFLAAPSKVVPGTRMVTAVPDPAKRKAIVGYLSSR
jgi:cytochrome c